MQAMRMSDLTAINLHWVCVFDSSSYNQNKLKPAGDMRRKGIHSQVQAFISHAGAASYTGLILTHADIMLSIHTLFNLISQRDTIANATTVSQLIKCRHRKDRHDVSYTIDEVFAMMTSLVAKSNTKETPHHPLADKSLIAPSKTQSTRNLRRRERSQTPAAASSPPSTSYVSWVIHVLCTNAAAM